MAVAAPPLAAPANYLNHSYDIRRRDEVQDSHALVVGGKQPGPHRQQWPMICANSWFSPSVSDRYKWECEKQRQGCLQCDISQYDTTNFPAASISVSKSDSVQRCFVFSPRWPG